MKDEDEDPQLPRHPSAKRRTHRSEPAPRRQRTPRSEFDFINQLRAQTLKRYGLKDDGRDSGSPSRPPSSSLIVGIGDDAAVVRSSGNGRDTLVTADLLVEDVDFRRTTTVPRLLGHKALAVSLSDIAAMGARPRYALLSLGLPRDIWRSAFLEEFYEGFHALADASDVLLVGGDVSRTPERIVIDSVVLGEAARGRAVRRAGARAGDRIFVTGALGGAAAGLQLLESGGRLRRSTATARDAATTNKAATPNEALMLRHLRPEPRVAWGRLLGEKRLTTAMIDLSDGLSSDLAHLCRESGVGALLDAARLPVEPLIEKARVKASDALRFALDGGEDYELLFTVRPRDAARLPQELDGVALTEIGEVTEEADGIKLRRGGRNVKLRAQGFQHFRPSRCNLPACRETLFDWSRFLA